MATKVAAPTSAPEAKAPQQKTDGQLVLEQIEIMARKVQEAEEHAERAERLSKVLDNGPKLKEKARRNSRDLQTEMATLMDGQLEAAFKQFDLDGNGTLEKDEVCAQLHPCLRHALTDRFVSGPVPYCFPSA